MAKNSNHENTLKRKKKIGIKKINTHTSQTQKPLKRTQVIATP